MCRYSSTLRGSGSRRVPRDIIAMTDFRIGRFVAATFFVPAMALLLVASVASAQAINTTPSSAAMAQGQAAAIAKARADSARYPYTTADVSFMSGMIHHHAQAIIMAKMAPTHGASPSVRTLCDRIINAQQDEITAMQRWLRDRNQTVPDATATAMKMVMNGMEHDMLMPGMLTDAQMKELGEARGTQFDRLFLTGMIQHHRGAVSMVADLFNTFGAAQDELTFKFASDVQVDQTTEIARMQKMLFMLELEGH
ncbi:hypothetical protein BH11GEM2_BH11GEM2_11650 [soil metagenome]